MFFARFFILSLVAGLPLLGVPCSAQAQTQTKSPFLELGSTTLTPSGWAEFCQRYAGDCVSATGRSFEISATDANVALVYRLNKEVNHSIKPLSDMDHWHEIDRWDYAEDGFGDCEDYALLKRKMLLAAGFPPGALLITIVRDENMEGHAVLVVRMDRGDLVLDNMNDELRLWWRTPYRFVKAQSPQNPNLWVGVGPIAVRPQISSR